MWPTVFKVVGGTFLTLAIVWALVLAWWQSNDFEPSRTDLVLYLGAIPLALIGGYWLLRGFIEHLKAPPPVEKPAAAALVDEDPLSGARAKTAAAERTFSLCLIDAFVAVAAGVSADDILGAIEAGKRPEPSARLMDDDGFPVFVAEVKDLDVDGMMERLLDDAGAVRQATEVASMVRSMALLAGVMGKVNERLEGLIEQSPEKLGLKVLWLVPGDWNPALFSGLRTWLQSTYWSKLEKADLEITLLPAANEADAMKQVDAAVLDANRDPSGHELILVVGATSAVDERSVESWAAKDKLFSAKHQDRQIPGEGAVALLMARRATVERLDLPEVAVISRVSHGARDKRLDAGGRIGGKLIEQLVEGLLDVTAVGSDLIQSVVFDADHRSAQVTEAMEGLGQTFKHLEPIKDCLATGTVNGSLAPIGSLIALACARAKVLADTAPVLCLSNQHELDRAVILAMPFVVQGNTEPSPT